MKLAAQFSLQSCCCVALKTLVEIGIIGIYGQQNYVPLHRHSQTANPVWLRHKNDETTIRGRNIIIEYEGVDYFFFWIKDLLSNRIQDAAKDVPIAQGSKSGEVGGSQPRYTLTPR